MPISASALGPKHRNAFTIAQHDAAQPLSVAVLNDDGMIDIADGPRMELTVKDLYLGPLDHAVPLVNDTPFFINLPCQGRHQPGIRDLLRSRSRQSPRSLVCRRRLHGDAYPHDDHGGGQ